jgi:hypothetical protein
MMRSGWLIPAIFLLAGILAAGSGCDDPTDPLDCTGGGRLQGQVYTGESPEEATIRVRTVPDENGNDSRFHIRPDAQGHYGIDLPAGDYLLEFIPNQSYAGRYDYTADGLGYGQAPPDTVTIDASVSPVEIDFRLGALALSVNMATPLEGARCDFFLKLRDEEETPYGPSYLAEGSTEFAGGRAEIHLTGVLPGEYRIEISIGARNQYWDCTSDGEHFWMPGIPGEQASPWYAVAADTVTTLAAAIEATPALVEGRIIGAWLDLGFNRAPALTLFTTDSIPVTGLCTVDSDGGFSLPLFQPQPVKLLVSQEGVDQWIGGPGFAEATVYDLQPGQTVSDIELVQSGLQIDSRGDKYHLWGPRIMLYDPADMSLIAATNWSGADGGLTGIANLWPGDFLLYFTTDPSWLGDQWWRPQWFDRAPDSAGAQVVTIGGPGEIVLLDVTVERGGTISGQVEDGAATIDHRVVFVAPADGDICWGFDSLFVQQTEFSVIGIPDGDYRVGVTPYGTTAPHGHPAPEGTIWYPGTPDWSEATIVEIRDGGDVEGLVITRE